MYSSSSTSLFHLSGLDLVDFMNISDIQSTRGSATTEKIFFSVRTDYCKPNAHKTGGNCPYFGGKKGGVGCALGRRRSA